MSSIQIFNFEVEIISKSLSHFLLFKTTYFKGQNVYIFMNSILKIFEILIVKFLRCKILKVSKFSFQPGNKGHTPEIFESPTKATQRHIPRAF